MDEKKIVMRSERFVVQLRGDVVRHRKSLLLKLKSIGKEHETETKIHLTLQAMERLEIAIETIRDEIESIALNG